MAFKKYSQIQKIQEDGNCGTSLGSVEGMGNPAVPSGDIFGSGDMFAPAPITKKKKKKKIVK